MKTLNLWTNRIQRRWHRYQGWCVIISVLLLDILLQYRISVFSEPSCLLLNALKHWGQAMHPLILAYGLGLIFVKYPLAIHRMFTWEHIKISKIIEIVAHEYKCSEDEATLGILFAIYEKDLDLDTEVYESKLITPSNSIRVPLKGNNVFDNQSGRPIVQRYEPIGGDGFRSLLYMYTSFLNEPTDGKNAPLKERYEAAYERLRKAGLDEYVAPQPQYEGRNIFLNRFRDFTMSGNTFKRWLKGYLLGKYYEILKEEKFEPKN